jgi:hypothetical protein
VSEPQLDGNAGLIHQEKSVVRWSDTQMGSGGGESAWMADFLLKEVHEAARRRKKQLSGGATRRRLWFPD